MRTNNKEIILNQHIKRYNSIRKKESRYLFALLILGIFFFFFANDDRKSTNEDTVIINENNTSFKYNSYSLKTTNKEIKFDTSKSRENTNAVNFNPKNIEGKNYDITFTNDLNTNDKKIKLKIPIIDVEIEDKYILISSPFILCIVLLGILGSIRASDRASRQIKKLCSEIGESFDESPHLVNLSMDWSTPSKLIPERLRSPGWVATLRYITIIFLPLWLAVFYIEIIYLIIINFCKAIDRGFVFTDSILAFLLIPLIISVSYRLTEYWTLALDKARREKNSYQKDNFYKFTRERISANKTKKHKKVYI